MGLSRTKDERCALAILGMLMLGLAQVQQYQMNFSRGAHLGGGPEGLFLEASQVTGYEHYLNETIAVSEGIDVVGGGQLVIENSTVVFTKDGIELTVRKGGSLTIKNAETGLYLGTAFNVSAIGNYMEKITYNGIYACEQSENIEIICNSVFDSSVGIYIEDADEVAVIGNLVKESIYCDVSIYYSDDVETYLNGFCSSIRTSADPQGSHVRWQNGTMGNFWCHYQGEDNDNDGIGDKMYVIKEGYYDFFPPMSFQTVLDFMESFSLPTPFWETTGVTAISSTNETAPAIDGQIALYLMVNSIIQLAGISLVVILVLYKRRMH